MSRANPTIRQPCSLPCSTFGVGDVYKRQELEEKWGVKRDDLEKSGDLDRMLNYGKSDLVRVSPNFEMCIRDRVWTR